MNSRSIRQTHNRASLRITAPLIGCLALTLAITGCGSEPEPPVAAAPTYTPPPPPPPAPRVTSISDLMAQLNIDNRIIFDESVAPDNDPARIAILEFFDGFARGDASAVASKLDPLDRRELTAMVESGQWRQASQGVESIWIYETGTASSSVSANDRMRAVEELLRKGNQLFDNPEEARQLLKDAMAMTDQELDDLSSTFGTPQWEQRLTELTQSLSSITAPVSASFYDGEQCVLAIMTVHGTEQAQLWYYRGDAPDSFTFQAAPTPPNVMAHLHGESWIKAWHDLIEREIMLASKPDDSLRPPQQQLEEAPTGGGVGPSPTGPTGPVPSAPIDSPPVLPQEAPGF